MYRFELPLRSRRELQDEYEQHAVVLEKALHELQRRVRRTVEQHGLQPTMKYRIKSFDSFYEKLLRRSRDLSDGDSLEITDLLGVRVVCPFVEDIATAEGILRKAFPVTEVERKGSELATTEFGYSSIHLLTAMPGDICDSFHLNHGWVCEVQLRTILQDAWAEVEHELVYKAELTPLDGKLRRKLAALNANLTLSDIIFQEIRDYQRALQQKLMQRRENFWSQVSGSEPVVQEQDGEVDAINTGSDTIDSMLINALHAHNRKDYHDAIRMYTDILAYQPADHVAAVIHSHRGMARFASGDAAAAIDDFSATIRLSPQTTRAYYYRGVVYRHQNRLETAMQDFSRCLEYDPYHVDSRIARARVYHEIGDVDAAIADLRMAEKLEPDHPQLDALRVELQSHQESEKHETTLRER
jgi:putative GTP pyrophosphokinase